jgi:hypothetical protein
MICSLQMVSTNGEMPTLCGMKVDLATIPL